MSAPAREARLIVPDGAEVPIEIVAAASEDDFLAALDIRRRVFAREQGAPDLQVADPDDARSLTALARIRLTNGGRAEMRAVSTGRLTPSPLAGGPALIAWVATVPEARGRGIGREVMRFLLDAADAGRIRQVTLAAQIPAEPFYRRLGFVTAGPRYDVRGTPHVRMIRHLPA